ncbi:MAG: shikimate dehydrogenase [Bacteroidia bacterium]
MPVIYGLLGRTLSHSFSKRYFTEKFAREQIDARYELFELADIAALPDLLHTQPGLRGLNVTIPYKEAVIPYLDRLADTAAGIGAVNTIAIGPEGLVGHNTDAFGFEQSLRDMLGTARPAAALILGTGGAAKAVAYVLGQRLDIPFRYVSRRGDGQAVLSYDDLGGLSLRDFPLIVNTTPLGMYPQVDEAPDLPYTALGPGHYVYDLVYNPADTLLLRRAAAQGARTCHGLAMLHLQAEQAWKIWTS